MMCARPRGDFGSNANVAASRSRGVRSPSVKRAFLPMGCSSNVQSLRRARARHRRRVRAARRVRIRSRAGNVDASVRSGLAVDRPRGAVRRRSGGRDAESHADAVRLLPAEPETARVPAAVLELHAARDVCRAGADTVAVAAAAVLLPAEPAPHLSGHRVPRPGLLTERQGRRRRVRTTARSFARTTARIAPPPGAPPAGPAAHRLDYTYA